MILYNEGPKNCRICIIGDAPGPQEIATDRPFTGNEGGLLNNILASKGIHRNECYITYVLKFMLPSMRINNRMRHGVLTPHLSFYKNKAKTSPEFDRALPALKEELSDCTALIYICLGEAAAYAMAGVIDVKKWRGSVVPSTLLPGRKCLITVSPSEALKKKARGQAFDPYNYRHYIGFDIEKAYKNSFFPEIRTLERTYRLFPSFSEAMSYMDNIIENKLTVGFDIETPKQRLGCFALAISKTDAMCINLFENRQHKFDFEEESKILLKLSELLYNEKVKKIVQNVDFDFFMLLWQYGMQIRNFEDTMIAQAILTPEYEMGLHFLTSIYTDEPYYKDEGGSHWNVEDEKAYFRYNCKDTVVLHEIFPEQETLLKQQGNWETYIRQKKIVPVLMEMEVRGIKVNEENLSKVKVTAEKELEETTKEFKELCGKSDPRYSDINPGSSKQLCEYFYIHKGYPPNMNGESLTVDEKAIRKILKKGSEEARVLLRHRKQSKMVNTYLKVSYDEDKRIRCDYVPTRAISYRADKDESGSRQGRLASSKTIFGTGMNMQNLPPAFKLFLVSDYGKE